TVNSDVPGRIDGMLSPATERPRRARTRRRAADFAFYVLVSEGGSVRDLAPARRIPRTDKWPIEAHSGSDLGVTRPSMPRPIHGAIRQDPRTSPSRLRLCVRSEL